MKQFKWKQFKWVSLKYIQAARRAARVRGPLLLPSCCTVHCARLYGAVRGTACMRICMCMCNESGHNTIMLVLYVYISHTSHTNHTLHTHTRTHAHTHITCRSHLHQRRCTHPPLRRASRCPRGGGGVDVGDTVAMTKERIKNEYQGVD